MARQDSKSSGAAHCWTDGPTQTEKAMRRWPVKALQPWSLRVYPPWMPSPHTNRPCLAHDQPLQAPPTSRRRLLLAAILLTIACAPAQLPPSPNPPPVIPTSDLRFDIGALDPKADPCADFCAFACGGWRATHPIPPDQTSWSRYAELRAENRSRARAIVEEAARGTAGASPAQRRIGTFYGACMDEAGIAARGLAPLQARLASIDAIRTPGDAIGVIADLQAHDVYGLFGAYVSTDPADSHRIALWIDRGDLGLPNAEDHASAEEDSVTLRARYVEHLTRLFSLLGETEAEAAHSAARTLTIETKLAAKALSAVERRHRENREHLMTIAELGTRYPAIDWSLWFGRLGAPMVDQVNVAQPNWMDAVNEILASDDLNGYAFCWRGRRTGVPDHLPRLAA